VRDRSGGALALDLYELTMAVSYLRLGMSAPATFSLFFRDLPPDRGFVVAAGLADSLDFLEEFHFDEADLDALPRLGFDEDAVRRLAALRFTGSVRAVPEGRVVFPNEPLLEVTAPIAEAQLVETYLLNQVSYQSAIATKAARCRLAAGEADLIDFAFRRTHGYEAGLRVARCSAMVGFAATSNAAAAVRYGLPAAGTMAHSYVQAFGSERDAFIGFARTFPDRTTFLVDTYDTLDGVEAAVEVIRELELQGSLAIRLDSGDLLELACASRAMLDEAGLRSVRILASGNLDEHRIATLVEAGAPIDAYGVGTRMGTSADAPYLDSVYKLVEYDGRPVMKLSPGKATQPGPKQVFRQRDGERPLTADLLAAADEEVPPGREPLLVPVMTDGKRLPAGDSSLQAARERFEADLGRLPAAALRLVRPTTIPVHVSRRLEKLTAEVRGRVARVGEREPSRAHHSVAHTADVGITATADDPEALLEEAAAALAEVSADIEEVAVREAVLVEVRGDDLPALVYAWLNELIGLADARGEALVNGRVSQLRHGPDGWELDAFATYAPYDPARVRPRLQVKAATLHGLAVRHDARGWTLEAYLDV
jgi:nicotinate phosphoribosyltransferase